ncbi:DUF3097 family protein [Halopolyspora algeriensis]|uniref:DUF3097 family protein n=1 Tax=Halopolyspora algeriensis TaxID=1500506 RepID=A0A368VVY7_9ACTN|nr:DUF3097 domain-containing protein [Halopolyspora algeriensis]RCW46009.1 DUF3097 family protein [Halopolyspora algeriensis]TQM55422.1 DUF3097 family protein [Halopolyspora algeriensis]
MRSIDYGSAVGKGGRTRRTVPEIAAETGLVVEDAASGFCGAVVRVERGNQVKHNVVLEDRHGRHRVFPMRPAAFLYEGTPATLVAVPEAVGTTPARSASGSVRVDGLEARRARGSRLWVEGLHDAELIERVWGHDLRVEGVVVEPLHGLDALPALLAEFEPGPGRRVGVLADHLVPDSKESRLVASIDDANVAIAGHPHVDIWQAVKPQSLGITAWPRVPRGIAWKDGVCAELGWGEPAEGWRRVLGAVSSFRDLQPPLIGAVERLIDFVTAEAD